MAYGKIHQPKLSDAIERRLEHLILDGQLKVGDKLPPERELSKQFEVSRPSLREAIQRLEMKGLLTRRQGGGTFVSSNLWKGLTDPLPELIASNQSAQFDLLETRHALEGIAAYYAALRGSSSDFDKIALCYEEIEKTQESGDFNAKAQAVMDYQLAVTKATHNIVLIHLLNSMSFILQKNVKYNFEQLYSRKVALEKVNNHRATICKLILERKPDEAREAAYHHLNFIEEVLLELNREHSRRNRSVV